MVFGTLETVPRATRIRVYTVVQKPPEFSQSPIMPKVLNTDTIVRLTDDSGQDGISPAMAIFAVAAKSELNVGLQSWGSSLSTAANLHLALANANSHYFEVPVPIDDFLIQGVDHFQLGSNGHVSAPKKAGLGLDVDWSIIEATASACVEF